MDDRRRIDPVERLVEGFLASQADAVDGRGLLERARRTQHARRARRQAALYTLAASLLMAAALFLVHSALKPAPRKPTPPDFAPMAKVVREQEEQVVKGMSAIGDATALPAREALGSLSPTSRSALDLLPDWSEAGRSLRADAREIKVNVDTLVSVSFHKAGLAL